MSSYIRRFTFDPGDDVLLNIESINILDLQPPQDLVGIGTGTVGIVGEFEDGPYNLPVEVFSANDLVTQFGSLGFLYNSVPANNACAIARRADGAAVPEYWNGNGFVQLSGKQFARLIVCRANTSVGSVQFTKLPFVTGNPGITFSMVSGQVVQLDVGAGPQSATFNAATAQITSAGATYAVSNGDTVTLGYDGQPNFQVTFLTGDNTQANVVARINSYAGFAFAAISGGQISFTSVQQGSQAQIRIVSASSGGVLTALGVAVSTALGTGNVANIASVTQLELAAVIQAAVANTRVDFDSTSTLRISNTAPSVAPYILVASGTTFPNNLGLAPVADFSSQQGQAIVVSTTTALPPLNGDTVTLGIDNYPNVVVTFNGTESTIATLISRVNAAFTAAGQPTVAFADGTTNWYLQSVLQNTTGSQVRIVAASSAAVLSKLGLSTGTTIGTGPTIGILAAGTVVQVPGGQVFVTAQAINFTTTGVLIGGKSTATGGVTQTTNGPWLVPIRHALDDGSGTSATAGSITLIGTVPQGLSFSVVNLQATTVALTESQIDAAYVNAVNATGNVNSVAKQINLIFSARQSSTVRSTLRTNAITASGSGCFGREAIIRPPLNTASAVAMSLAAPGVGATRDRRVIYTYIGANTFVPLIAQRGLSGNPLNTGYTAFTPDGNIDVGPDGFMASICSQLPPEENPGQDTPFVTTINGIEKGANVQSFQMTDYIAFKAAGIAALRIDDGQASFQSGVTSVDPTIFPGLVNISRQRMSDYINDTIAQGGKAFGKKLSTSARRLAYANEVKAFLEGLLSKSQPQFQRIAGFTLDIKSANTTARLAKGMYRLRLFVQTLASLDSIVIESVIGNQVQTQETLPQAA